MSYVFHSFILFCLTKIELDEIKLDGCIQNNNGIHTTSPSKGLSSPSCLILRKSSFETARNQSSSEKKFNLYSIDVDFAK